MNIGTAYHPGVGDGFSVNLYQIRMAYEYFYVKEMPKQMPYTVALEILLKEIPLDVLKAQFDRTKE